MKYISVTIQTTSEASDIVSLILMENGSEGVSIVDQKDVDFVKQRVHWDYADAHLFKGDKVFVTGVFEKDKDIDSIKNALISFKKISEVDTGSLEIKTAPLDSKDYEDEWKKYYDIIDTGGFCVVPAWLDYNGNNPYIKINPGKAFGTGNHETTLMCLQLLNDLDVKNKRVIDIGCGSGILGLSALKLGAESVYMSDIDVQAIEASIENAALNSIKNAKIVLWGEKEIDEFFSKSLKTQTFNKDEKADICLANLTADILISLLPNINKLLKKGGALIVSGIINDRADEVKAAFKDLSLIKNIKNGEWQAFSFVL